MQQNKISAMFAIKKKYEVVKLNEHKVYVIFEYFKEVKGVKPSNL